MDAVRSEMRRSDGRVHGSGCYSNSIREGLCMKYGVVFKSTVGAGCDLMVIGTEQVENTNVAKARELGMAITVERVFWDQLGEHVPNTLRLAAAPREYAFGPHRVQQHRRVRAPVRGVISHAKGQPTLRHYPASSDRPIGVGSVARCPASGTRNRPIRSTPSPTSAACPQASRGRASPHDYSRALCRCTPSRVARTSSILSVSPRRRWASSNAARAQFAHGSSPSRCKA